MNERRLTTKKNENVEILFEEEAKAGNEVFAMYLKSGGMMTKGKSLFKKRKSKIKKKMQRVMEEEENSQNNSPTFNLKDLSFTSNRDLLKQ